MPRLTDIHPYGPRLWAETAEEQGGHKQFACAFSRGKDSIVMALVLREAGYELFPYFMYFVPGLEFVDESLAYYERVLFDGRKIEQVIHPSMVNMIEDAEWQPPHRRAVAKACGVHVDDWIIQQLILDRNGLPMNTWTARGARAAESLSRRRLMWAHGPRAPKKRTFYPIWEMLGEDIRNHLKRFNVKLPVDYQLYGRSFVLDEFACQVGIRKHFPRDWAKIVEFFPLIEAGFFHERMRHEGNKGRAA